jgi:hypothetical protein
MALKRGALSSSSAPSSETIFNILYAAYGAQERRIELIICPVVWNNFQHLYAAYGAHERRTELIIWPVVWNNFQHFIPRHTALKIYDREYWMIYRGTGFLAVIWLCSTPHQLPPSLSRQQVVSLFLSLPVCRRSSLYWWEREKGCAQSLVIRPQGSLVLYKSFNTLWSTGSMHSLSFWTL